MMICFMDAYTITCMHACMQVDASHVPSDYEMTVLNQCAAFPRRLIFFIKGQMTVRSAWLVFVVVQACHQR